MNYYKIKITVEAKGLLHLKNRRIYSSNLVNRILKKSEEGKEYHEKWQLKDYSIIPVRIPGDFMVEGPTFMTIKTSNKELAFSFMLNAKNTENDLLKVIDASITEECLPTSIKSLKTIEPVLIKTNRTKEEMKQYGLEDILEINGVNKYNKVYSDNVNTLTTKWIEEVDIFDIPVNARLSVKSDKKLRAHYMRITPKQDELSQKIASSVHLLGAGHHTAGCGFGSLVAEKGE